MFIKITFFSDAWTRKSWYCTNNSFSTIRRIFFFFIIKIPKKNKIRSNEVQKYFECPLPLNNNKLNNNKNKNKKKKTSGNSIIRSHFGSGHFVSVHRPLLICVSRYILMHFFLFFFFCISYIHQLKTKQKKNKFIRRSQHEQKKSYRYVQYTLYIFPTHIPFIYNRKALTHSLSLSLIFTLIQRAWWQSRNAISSNW